MAAIPLRIECHADSEPWVIEQRMFDILNDYLQPTSTMSPKTAAEQFNLCFPLHRPDEEGTTQEGVDVRGDREGEGEKEDNEGGGDDENAEEEAEEDDDEEDVEEENSTGKESPESFLWEMWDLVLRVGQQVPYDHPSQEKLAQLLKELKNMPVDTKVVIWNSEQKIWADLPIFHPNVIEFANSTC